MINLTKIANKHKLRLNSDGNIRLLGPALIPVELYLCCETEACLYLKKCCLHRALVKLGGVVQQEGDFEIILRFPEKQLEEIVDFIKKYEPMR